MTILQIKPEYMTVLMNDEELKLKIALANKVKVRTVDDWRRGSNSMLTTATNLNIMKEHLNLENIEDLVKPVDLEVDKVKVAV
jgi:hypothetical protein